jgi:preprotein translocase subunit SecE
MELDKIEIILEKYFDGETSIAEEKELKDYFASSNVAQHLEQYKPLFGYFSQAKQEQYKATIPLKKEKRTIASWISIAAAVVVLLGVGIFTFMNYNDTKSKEFGTYDDPEIAFRETQKALALISEHVNTGIESAAYINEYEQSKNKIFK